MIKNIFLIGLLFVSLYSFSQSSNYNAENYLAELKEELTIKWPKNRTINLVFHGHSVPAGYFKTPDVNTFDSYPFHVLKALKEIYPFAVINAINTSIGGENSESGEARFNSEVLTHKPDVLFIDYALNDRGMGLDKSRKNWERMIEEALKKDIKIILLTSSPDQRVDISKSDTILDQFSEQIESLALQYEIGIIDSYQLFKDQVSKGNPIVNYMSQVNHPNKLGHKLIADAILEYFK